jgi:hypothetical protein
MLLMDTDTVQETLIHDVYIYHAILLQCVTKPRDSLRKGLLLGEPDMVLAQIPTTGKPMSHAAEQIDLEGLPGPVQGLLG